MEVGGGRGSRPHAEPHGHRRQPREGADVDEHGTQAARGAAASKAAFLGVVALLLAAGLEGDGPILTRVVLITVLLAITTPVAAHVVAQAAWIRGEEMRTPGAVDETAGSGRPQPARRERSGGGAGG